MSSFSYSDYNTAVEAAKASRASGDGQFVKVGYFKLEDDGDEALVRFNLSSVDELHFASTHVINAGSGKWIKVSCLNPIGGNGDSCCALCDAVRVGNTSIDKAKKRVFLQAMVAYKDRSTGAFAAAKPVIWERPASFSRDIANALKDYGDLRNVLFKVTRNGAKKDMHTTYSLAFAVPTIFKPELVPADFSAFSNFNFSKHSYYEKTTDEIDTFLATGSFPEAISDSETSSAQTAATVQPTQPQAPYVPQTAAPEQAQEAYSTQPTHGTTAQTVYQPAPTYQPQTTPETGFGQSKYSF